MADVDGRAGVPDDVQAGMGASFGYGTERDEMSEREIDLTYEAEMERRERESRVTFWGAPDNDDDTRRRRCRRRFRRARSAPQQAAARSAARSRRRRHEPSSGT